MELLAHARAGLDEASVLESANERFATAHLAALWTAAAVLAARGGPREEAPGVRRRSRIRSAWEVLPEVAPELTEWCALFAAKASARARAEAGIEGAASMRDAEDLIRDAAMFLRLAERMLLRDADQQRRSSAFRRRPTASAEADASPPRPPFGHTPPGPPLGDDDDEWDE
ncbi:SAV_6107 family HEPN domain-containing protein [Streptomyces sp. NPDC054864]